MCFEVNARTLTPELRMRLKAPLGRLFTGDEGRAAREAWSQVLSDCPAKIIVVGDRVTLDSAGLNVRADLYIVDRKVMRQAVSMEYPQVDKTFEVENPPGTITSSAVEAVRRAVASCGRVRITVRGEEDLLTLPAILEAPIGSCVVYGQPGIGVVVVKVTEEKKREVQAMVEAMPLNP
ncbi:MAG: DUF359 domain-containing protein [Candidatus Bathyarchaeia archaeon]